jgi:hypothetical protein
MNNDCQTPNDCPLKGRDGQQFWKEFGELQATVKEIHEMLKIQNGRVRSLEAGQAKIMGGAAILAIVFPVLIKLLWP